MRNVNEYLPRLCLFESVDENFHLPFELFFSLLGFLFGDFQGFQVLADLSKFFFSVNDFVLAYEI